MLGVLKVAWGARKHVAGAGRLIVGAIKGVSENREKVEQIVSAVKDSQSDLTALYKSFKQKLDTDGDGVSDLTKKEILELLAEVIFVIVKRL
jgi:hypothetical protein